MAISKLYNGEITVDPVNHVVAVANHNGTTQGLKLGSVLVTKTADQLNGTPVTVTAAGAITTASAGTTTIINSAAGRALTLPAATGTGNVYRFIIGVTVTSSATTITAAGSDKYYGVVLQSKAATTIANYNATGSSSVISLNGSTTGGLIGDEIVLVDVGSAKWALKAVIQGTGVIASPLS